MRARFEDLTRGVLEVLRSGRHYVLDVAVPCSLARLVGKLAWPRATRGMETCNMRVNAACRR